MRTTPNPYCLVLSLPLVLGAAGAAAAADSPETISQSPPVKVIRGTSIDPFGRPVAHPTVTAVGTVNGMGGIIIVVRGAPSALPSRGFAPPPLGSGPMVPPLTGFGGSSSDTRFANGFDNRFDNRFNNRFDNRFNNRFDNRFDNRFNNHFASHHGHDGHHGIRTGTSTPSFVSVPQFGSGAFGGHGGGFGGHGGGGRAGGFRR
jgi:hypothetical protein